MRSVDFISLIHEIISIVHSSITSVIAFYIIYGYFGGPLNISLDETYSKMLYLAMLISLVYFTLSTIIIVFFEQKNKKSNQMIFHHIIAFVAIWAASTTRRYMPFYGMWYIMEVSSIFLCFRTIARNLDVLRDKAVLFDLMFIVSYVSSRFIVPIYVYIQLILSPDFSDSAYLVVILLSTISIILNLIWLKELYGMIKYKFFGGKSNKNNE